MRAVVTRTSGAGDNGASEHCAETQYCKLVDLRNYCILIMWILSRKSVDIVNLYCDLLISESIVFCILNKFYVVLQILSPCYLIMTELCKRASTSPVLYSFWNCVWRNGGLWW